MIRLLCPMLVLCAAGLCWPGSSAHASGRLLAASCSGCHQAGVEQDIPSLNGRDRQALLDILLAYRTGKRDGTLMQRIVRGYSEAELDAIAEYLTLDE